MSLVTYDVDPFGNEVKTVYEDNTFWSDWKSFTYNSLGKVIFYEDSKGVKENFYNGINECEIFKNAKLKKT